MFSFFRKLFGGKSKPVKPRLVLPSHTQAQAPQPAAVPAPAPMKPPAKADAGRPGHSATPKAKEEWAKQAARRISADATPEQLCGIAEGMTPDQISAQLALLYRRHNRAASSLENNLREEAEIMLDVIAAMREKHLPK
jgi:hypothetical protein